MLEVLNTLIPVFLVIALGWALAHWRFLSEVVLNEINQLLFWVCLPALIVHKLATASEIPSGTGVVLLVFCITTLAVIALGLLVARMRKLKPNQVGTFVQAAFRGNLAYAGIPIILFALQDSPQAVIDSVMAQTLFVFAPAMLLYNSAAVVLLLQDSTEPIYQNIGLMLKKVTRNPLILASLGGAILFFLPFKLPVFAANSLDLVGQMAAPAALLCVGGSMAYVSMEGRYRSACLAAILKVMISPLLAYGIAACFELSAESRLVLLILSACPTAVASYVMAKQLKGDEALASGAVLISTLASIPSFAVILWLV